MNTLNSLSNKSGAKHQFLYWGEFTPLAAQMMTEFGTMKYARGACQGDAKQLEHIDQEYQAPIARIIDKEIEYQKWLSKTEAYWADIEFPLDGLTFPADPILDRVECYRTANARGLSRLLENLETVRRLCPKK